MTRTLRSKKLRAALYYAFDGKCAICGRELPDDWHADHIIPWSATHRTNVHEMQPLCPDCNRKKGTKMLRKHQREMQQIAQEIRRGSRVTNILASVTPGGGKSGMVMIVAKELAEPMGYKICWVVPRDSLRSQGERGFQEKRHVFGHSIGLRASGNDINPSGDEGGCIVTYQAITANPELWRQEFARHPYILVLDECHHVPDKGDSIGEDAAYFAAISPLVELAKIRIFASGTLNRHDGHRIAFIPYVPYVNGESPATGGVDGWRFIRYSRKDALEERAVVPLHCHVMDGKALWYDKMGNMREVESMATAALKDQPEVLRTALETEYAHRLLDKCVSAWNDHKAIYPKAKLLVIAPRQDTAREYLRHLKSSGVSALLAVSDMADDAKRNIDRFKKDVNVLVTVGMASEGLDVPEVTHIALLTNVRSEPYIEQAICRANRTDSGKTHGYIYYPDDARMRTIMERVEAEQAAVVVTWPRETPGSRTMTERISNMAGFSTPIASDTTGERSHGLEDGTSTDYTETAAIMEAMRHTGMSGISVVQAKQFLILLGAGVMPNGNTPEPDYSSDVLAAPPSQREAALRKTIDNQVKRIGKGDPDRIQSINAHLKRLFGSRIDAREKALSMIVRYVTEHQRELESL